MREAGVGAQARALLAQQKQTWELLRNNYAGLEQVEMRRLQFDGFAVDVQFNPGRITSTSAKVDEKTLRERKCFLCHRPAEQRGLAFAEYVILCNPYPIFREHFTIVHRAHQPQRVASSFMSLLDLSAALGPDYATLYNGPRSGASAPDHLHLQAGERNFMRVDTELSTILLGDGAERLISSEKLSVWAVESYLRPIIVMESADAQALSAAFEAFCRALSAVRPAEDEPMMNIIVLCTRGTWQVVLFPRAQHRPSCYYAEGDERLMLSPGAVDLGGVLITPRQEDYARITEADVIDIFDEVSLIGPAFRELVYRLESELT